MSGKAYVWDIETFSNLFTLVAKEKDEDKFLTFVIHESRSDLDEMLVWLDTKPSLVGYNSINFDGQIIQKIMDREISTAEEIYACAQELIERLTANRFNTFYAPWEMKLAHLDLMALNHYGVGTSRTTSLKWLEFTTRARKLEDLPLHHEDFISESQIESVIKYNKTDVLNTEHFYKECANIIDLRKNLASKYRERRILNMSDASIGTFVMNDRLTKALKKDKKAIKSSVLKRDKIEVKDIIFPYIDTTEFQDILESFKNIKLYPDEDGQIILKKVFEFSHEMDGMSYDFGAGGIHGARKGYYEANDDYVIVDSDFTSYYPNLAIKNKLYPEHLGPKFCDIYNNLYLERGQYAKGTAENYAIKIVLNSVYGQSNSKYSALFDPQFTLAITVNGQLLLADLAEKLTKIGQICLINTDGLITRLPKEHLEEYHRICDEFCQRTKLNLEHEQYSKLALRDVNNYVAETTEGKRKRKGAFETYGDFTSQDGTKPFSYHKNPSACILAEAANAYLLDGIEPEVTIMEHNNIHDFLYGIKKNKSFRHLLIKAEDSIVSTPKINNDRAMRYYVSTNGYNLIKQFMDPQKATQFSQINKGELIRPLPNVLTTNVYKSQTKKAMLAGEPKQSKYGDLNYDYYIKEAWKLINSVIQ